ncbi:long-chain-fatty acid-CoA ligase protein, putative [Leishmania donovani]|uniref:AMP-binding enzyme family protein n=1 Tax=Leishmania donovani TaxID=5661 RepID=A0A3Q8I9I3_LEIDO|nr:long-chain-fatty acid-CoA ligase protein, putative [Leishmania donovani]AYU77109.1 long-chain-fatty-acid-CoA ligase, putative [Leishmania donovani]TPP45132.1 AMP-binding enzyme family protein [Leishmania donovani]CBZ32530.1 long-chain-fatty acid-CoA ligase protein, putative [Leishmania donovani]
MLQRLSRRSVLGYHGAPQVAALRCSLRFGTNIGGSYYQESDTAGTHQMNNDIRLGLVIKPQSTLVELWEQALKAWPTRRFLGSKMWVRGKLGYIWATYESINTEVEAMRTLLHSMGVEKGSRVVVISENRYEWVVVHFATMQLGAHFVALPTNVTPSEAQLVVKSTQSKVLFVETKASYAAIKGWIGRVGQLEHAICFEDQVGEGSYAVAISIAADVPEKTLARTDVRAEDTAMIVFTAGTTGPPKGVMLSHKSIVANVSSVYASLGEALTHSDMFMSLCSWCVAGALTTDLYQALCKGACVCIPPEILEGFQDLPLVNPSVIVSVAQPFQRAYANIVDDILNRGSFTKDLTRFVVGRITENRLMFKKPGRTLRAFSHALLGKFKAQFGSELRVAIIIGHQLTKDQSELMADLDVFVVNTYGFMEAGGLVATDVDVPQRLKALPGLEVRVVNEKNEIVAPGDLGEILVEAPNAMQGYFDVHIDPEEAKNSLVEYGSRTFVRSGDYGTLTGGWITVKGNKDVLITLANSKTVNPLEVEAALTKSPLIKQVFIYGNRRPYVVALVVANTKAIAAHLRKVERRDGVPLVNDREKADCIRTELRRVSQDLPPRAHVRRFAFVDEFTLANGFMTVKMGYARQKIEDHYVHYFEALYDETPKFYGFAVDDYDDLF